MVQGLLGHLMVIFLVRKLPASLEHEGSLPCSQEPPMDTILCQFNPVHIFTTYFSKPILTLSSNPVSLLPNKLSP
jgi:hypothetical protein